MNRDEVLDLIKMGEGLTLELKETINASMGKEICAFANAIGGKIILGVADNGTVTGIQLSNADMSKVQDIARNMNPHFQVMVKRVDNLAVIFVTEGNDKPYMINGSFYLRQGANSQKLSRDEIRDLFQRENRLSFEKQTTQFDENDFSLATFYTFCSRASISESVSKKHILENLNLLTNEVLNNAGVLFFSNRPNHYFPSSGINCFLFTDNEQTEILDSKSYTNDFMSNLENAFTYLVSKLNTAIVIKKTLQHQTRLELPREALREALINAIIHRDYAISSTVQINVSPQKVEIINPGRLLFSKSEFGKISVRRNPILVDLVHRIGWVEKAGTGINRIKKQMRKYNAKIRFETGDFFRVTFYRDVAKQSHFSTKIHPREVEIRHKSDANRTQIGRKSNANQRAEWILHHLNSHKTIRSEEICLAFNVVKDTALRDLRNLLTRRKITKKGAGNNVWYERNENPDKQL